MSRRADEPSRNNDPFDRPEVQWGVGCLLAFTALTGLVIITLLIAIALEPPRWLQVVIGLGLVVGGAALAWLVATAIARSKRAEQQLRGPSSVDPDRNDRPPAT